MANRTLVTGGTGFIGTNLVDELRRGGREVRIVSRAAPRRPEHAPWFAQGDIMDRDRLAKTFAEFAPTDVVHLAARTDFLTREDAEGFRTNTEGTRNVLRAAAMAKVARCVFVSSHV